MSNDYELVDNEKIILNYMLNKQNNKKTISSLNTNNAYSTKEEIPLFLFEFYIFDLILPKEVLLLLHNPILTFRLLDYPSQTIIGIKDQENNRVKFNTGKSCFFQMEIEHFKIALRDEPLYIMLLDSSEGELKLLASSKVNISLFAFDHFCQYNVGSVPLARRNILKLYDNMYNSICEFDISLLIRREYFKYNIQNRNTFNNKNVDTNNVCNKYQNNDNNEYNISMNKSIIPNQHSLKKSCDIAVSNKNLNKDKSIIINHKIESNNSSKLNNVYTCNKPIYINKCNNINNNTNYIPTNKNTNKDSKTQSLIDPYTKTYAFDLKNYIEHSNSNPQPLYYHNSKKSLNKYSNYYCKNNDNTNDKYLNKLYKSDSSCNNYNTEYQNSTNYNTTKYNKKYQSNFTQTYKIRNIYDKEVSEYSIKSNNDLKTITNSSLKKDVEYANYKSNELKKELTKNSKQSFNTKFETINNKQLIKEYKKENYITNNSNNNNNNNNNNNYSRKSYSIKNLIDKNNELINEAVESLTIKPYCLNPNKSLSKTSINKISNKIQNKQMNESSIILNSNNINNKLYSNKNIQQIIDNSKINESIYDNINKIDKNEINNSKNYSLIKSKSINSNSNISNEKSISEESNLKKSKNNYFREASINNENKISNDDIILSDSNLSKINYNQSDRINSFFPDEDIIEESIIEEQL